MMMHVPFVSNLIVDSAHHVAGNSQTDSFVASRLGENKRIDADDATAGACPHPAAIAGVDGRVCLNVNRRTVGIWLPGDGTYDPHAHRVIETQRTAEGQY